MNGSNFIGIVLGYAGPIVSLLIAVMGGVLLRRRPVWLRGVPALAILAGWTILAGGLRVAIWPRSLAEHLILPAVLVLVAAAAGQRLGRWGQRWLAVGCAGFAGWWLGSAPGARPEFWRVGFAVMMASLVLNWVGAARPRRGLVAGLTVLGGLVVGGVGPVWTGVMLVLVGAAGGLAVTGASVLLPTVSLGAGVVAADLGAGRMMSGAFTQVDAACCVALVAPALEGWFTRGLGARLGRSGSIAAPLLLAVAAVAASWVLSRAMR